MRKAKLDGVDSLTIYGREGVLLILSDELGTMQSIMVVDMLREMAGDLLTDIIMKAKDYESKCRKVSIPVAVLEMAGIPEGAPLEFNAGDGVLHLSVPDEEDDIDGTLPAFLKDKLVLFLAIMRAASFLLKRQMKEKAAGKIDFSCLSYRQPLKYVWNNCRDTGI